MAEGQPVVQVQGFRVSTGGHLAGYGRDETTAAQRGRYGADGSGDAPLGIYAENYSPSGTARLTAEGELLGIAPDARSVRAERFALKSAAVRLLDNGHRTSKCMRWRVPKRPPSGVMWLVFTAPTRAAIRMQRNLKSWNTWKFLNAACRLWTPQRQACAWTTKYLLLFLVWISLAIF